MATKHSVKQSFEHNEVVVLKKFKDDLMDLSDSSDADSFFPKHKTMEDVWKDMGLDAAAGYDLETVCNPTSLSCLREGDITNWECISSCPDDLGLNVLQARKQTVRKVRQNMAKKKTTIVRSKYTELDCALLKKYQEIKRTGESDMIDIPEVLLIVRLSFPRCIRRHKSIHYDFCVLGSQTLDSLRDKICCPMNVQPLYLEGEAKPLADMITSASFLIEDTFYNDHRKETDIDLSEIVMQWARDNPEDHELPSDPKVKSMNETKFEDLTIRLGKPYVFLHMGNCEHEITFVDVRSFNEKDCQSKKEYPMAITRPRMKVIPCKCCHSRVSTWITRNDDFSDEDPSFFCNRCFEGLHFNDAGEKMGAFEARPFINLTSLV